MQKLFFFSYEVVSREEEEDKMRKKNMRGVRSVLIHFDSGHLLQMDRCPDGRRKGKGILMWDICYKWIDVLMTTEKGKEIGWEISQTVCFPGDHPTF